MDVVALSKLQFALTVMYHFLFVPLSIGVGLVLVLAERRYYKSGAAGGQGGVGLLDQDLHGDVRRGGRYRHRDGVRLRHQLGDVLALRRGHLRSPTRRRGAVRLLPGVHVPRACCSSVARGSPRGSSTSRPGSCGLARCSRRCGSSSPTPGCRPPPATRSSMDRKDPRRSSPTSSRPHSTPRRCPATSTRSTPSSWPAASSPSPSRRTSCARARTSISAARP